MRKPTRASLLALLLVLVAAAACAESEVGVVGGISFAGRQDLTIEGRSAPEGAVVSVTQEPDLPVHQGSAVGLSFIRWTRSHPSLGLSLDALYWTDSFRTTGRDPARTIERLDQQRTGVFSSLAARVSVDRKSGAFAFATLGMGIVDSRLVGGDQRIGAGLSATTGLSVSLTPNLLARFEARYLITHDFDSDDSKNQNLEFSGSPSWTTARRVFGGHQDTRFLPILFGLFWRF